MHKCGRGIELYTPLVGLVHSTGYIDMGNSNSVYTRPPKGCQALQLHFGSLSCVDVMDSSGSDSTFDEVETQRDFDEAIAGDDDDDDCGHDESVCDTFDDHLTYG